LVTDCRRVLIPESRLISCAFSDRFLVPISFSQFIILHLQQNTRAYKQNCRLQSHTDEIVTTIATLYGFALTADMSSAQFNHLAAGNLIESFSCLVHRPSLVLCMSVSVSVRVSVCLSVSVGMCESNVANCVDRWSVHCRYCDDSAAVCRCCISQVELKRKRKTWNCHLPHLPPEDNSSYYS